MFQTHTVTLLGYTNPKHTNWYPWDRFLKVFRELGYQTEWTELKDLDRSDRRPRCFICWNEPDTDMLVESGKYQSGDVIIQKLTSFGRHNAKENWTNDPMSFFKDWHWPLHQMVERHLDNGVNIYAFGCRTDSEPFPEKHRIIKKLGDRYFPIPWGSSLFDWPEIRDTKPVMDNLRHDVAWVGTIWGTPGRGNIDTIEHYLKPIISRIDGTLALAGKGTKAGPVDDLRHKAILRSAKVCPILNAPSWRIENGVQDRFWTIFTAGRFGVVDVPGILEFFDEGEVVVGHSPEDYIDKTMFFVRNPELQLPFIDRIQTRIKKEYNYYQTWSNILSTIGKGTVGNFFYTGGR